MDSWVGEQTRKIISQFNRSMGTHHSEASRYASDPEKLYTRICEECNYLEAVRGLDWPALIPRDATVLDLGGGTGWLSAFLSRFENVARVLLVDTDLFYLSDALPVMIRRLSGVSEKIHPVEGFFTPILRDDKSVDVVVMSSAIHHADSLQGVMEEVHRVLSDNGTFVILNETPLSSLKYLIGIVRYGGMFLRDSVFHVYKKISPAVSSSGILYDPFLGDRFYSPWYWQAAIAQSGFDIAEWIKTDFPTVKGGHGIPLTHAILRKSGREPSIKE